MSDRVTVWLATNGRLTCFGPPAIPMVTLTMRGRRTGKLRSVHLACIEHPGVPHVVASALGQPRHPGWRYNLEANLQDLHARMKAKRHRHQPIRRVTIPKEQGKTRPIGISAFEDELVLDAVREVLEAVYEQDFLDCSYAFRPDAVPVTPFAPWNRSCTGAR